MEPITVQVIFLGPSRDWTGMDRCELRLSQPATIEDLRKALAARYVDLAPAIQSVRFAVNDEFSSLQTSLFGGEEVALIPPVSGGAPESIYVELTPDSIDAGQVRDFVGGDPRFGGIVTFEGVTRCERDDNHGELVRLDYESHESMATKQLKKLAELALQRWGPGKVALVHRTGSVAPGEVSVMIAVATGHRAEAFEACRWLIDTLKKDVPIWKKDVFEDGTVRWVRGEIGDSEEQIESL